MSPRKKSASRNKTPVSPKKITPVRITRGSITSASSQKKRQRTEQPAVEIISDRENNLEDISYEEASNALNYAANVNDSDSLHELTTKEASHIATSSKSIVEDTVMVLPSPSNSSVEMVTLIATSHISK
ncbi:1012_t:CDS:2, partial [Scutellospora calospora]